MNELSILLGLGAILFPLVVPLVLLNWKRRWLAPYLGLYLLVYCLLSLNGSYVPYIAGAAGGSIWYPYGFENRQPGPTGRVKTEYPNEFGMLFWPLLYVDQLLVHPSQPDAVWTDTTR